MRAVGVFVMRVASDSAPTQNEYDTGASDREIRIGNIMPYSGPASPYSVMGKTQEAYFNKINAEGGINGRKIKFISYDDAYDPRRTLELARKLVEGDKVLLLFSTLGTPTNAAIRSYLNSNQIPQLFVASGASKWQDPKNFPWTIGFQPTYKCEGRIYARFLLANHPRARICILYQDDDYGRDYIGGFKEGLGDKMEIIAEASYRASDASIARQMTELKTAGADVFFNVTTPTFAVEAIREVAGSDWRPVHILNEVSASIGGVLAPAGLINSIDILSTAFFKDPGDPQWRADDGYKEWAQFMDTYYPQGNRLDANTVYGHLVSQTLMQVLRRCGDKLTRFNVMKLAMELDDLELGMLLPGIKVNARAFAPVSKLQMVRFNGSHWEHFGPIMSGD
jgi:branched-chain amino acid transport system substrate-binding protein